MVGKSKTLNELGDWSPYFVEFKTKKAYSSLQYFLNQEKQRYQILPKRNNWFLAFKLCSLSNTKVVILGQDPYPSPNHAHGLCFSVPENTKPLPPSLQNIFSSIKNDIGKLPQNSNLSYLATQGVLLLNAVLTVRSGVPASHQNQGWEDFTNFIIQTISEQKENIVFLLWGSFAKQKIKLIDSNKHLILTSSHPSPLSAHLGFLTCKHFSQTNNYLTEHRIAPINWIKIIVSG